MNKLTKMMQAMSVGATPAKPPTPPPAEESEEKKKTDWSVGTVAEYIKENDLKNIVILCGAGISASAGIPDFRSPGTGLYSRLEELQLPYPEAIFELDYLQQRPEAFYTVAKALWPGGFEPTKAHWFIKKLHDDGRLRMCFTQNIDGLEDQTGLPGEKCIPAHGNFRKAFCTQCRAKHSIEDIKPTVMKGEIPRCPSPCDGIIKPTIVFFGEDLPATFFKGVKEHLPRCDLLIVMGTSLVVHPFASLVNMVGDDVPRLLINNNKVGLDLGLFKDADRDIHLDGEIDTRVKEIADGLGYTL
eukprot:TRINITY_DN645_c3_g1_i2.p1 TRINITY_DN645_c3_g1~~TRINITY_DN645_c3_g1_i2.p1  ORF type:complete len:310 (+),score=48.92 TRINITY_DN645_c3_g1_i2:32-931(+)